MDEAQLQSALLRAQQGDGVAFGHVYERFAPRVFRLCRKMLGAQAAAEDATSEVFERARAALAHYDSDRPFDRWLLTIASRHCLNRLRRAHTERRLFHDAAPEPSTAPTLSPLALYETQQQQQAVMDAIDALPENYRVPLILKYFSELSYDEIAEHLGITRDNVAVLLHRAKRELRQSLGGWRKERA
jgi:RNA polymerase sigma-70 factor (ECF subfamily)